MKSGRDLFAFLQAAKKRARQQVAQASLLQTFSEAFGGTEGDPGHWNLSPEWFGNQGGSWGHNAGHVIFSQESLLGNGLVRFVIPPAALNLFFEQMLEEACQSSPV